MTGIEDHSGVHAPPEASKGDIGHAIARAGLSAIPVLGGAAVEIFSALVTPPLERRRDEWMREVGGALADLEKNRGVDIASLRNNDAFIDVVLGASQIAMRASQEEKRQALRNAVLNSALPSPLDEARQQFFLHLVDVFTVWHLRLIHLFSNPPSWFRMKNRQVPSRPMGALATLLEDAYPELTGERSFYDQVWRDVNAYGLSGTPTLHSMMNGPGVLEKRLSPLGEQFLAFISLPPPNESGDA